MFILKRYLCQCEERKRTGRVLPATEVDPIIPEGSRRNSPVSNGIVANLSWDQDTRRLNHTRRALAAGTVFWKIDMPIKITKAFQ